MKEMAKKICRITLSIPEDVNERIRKEATMKQRSLSNLVACIIKEYLSKPKAK